MNNLQNNISEQIKESLKSGDKTRLSVLRQLKTSISEFALKSGNISNPVSDLEIISIIRKRIKQGEDSVEQFSQANRNDLIVKEMFELDILREYLPQSLSEEEIDKLVQKAIWDSGAVDKKGMGKAIKKAQELANGQVENKILSEKIRIILEKGS